MASGNFTVRLKSTDPKEIKKFQAVLKNPEAILKQIGVVLLGEAQKAFREQALDDEKWPARYGGKVPHVNVAGLISDFIAGRSNPPARRFQPRPAGIDTGMTLRSLTPSKAITTIPYTVQVKSNTDGAAALQNGAITTQLLTKQVKKRLAEWMKHSRRRAKRERGRAQPMRMEDAAAQSLGWLFSKKSLKTHSVPRPFLGITREAEAKIIRITGGEFVKEVSK